MGPEYPHPHLIYTTMGDATHDPWLCYSFVGKMRTRGQVINLGQPQCFAKGMILHETLHALGLSLLTFPSKTIHEMMRPDRDQFVEILFDNIQPGQEGNFKLKASDTHSSRRTPFDWRSIMMYGPTDAGKLDITGKRTTTIRPLLAGVEIRCRNRVIWCHNIGVETSSLDSCIHISSTTPDSP